jgi:hypothetical protein
MLPGTVGPAQFEVVAHVIQIALTPIFLLSGIAALLNVFSTRHNYVTQHVDQILAEMHSDVTLDMFHVEQQLRTLKWRSMTLDAAVILGILGGASTCAAALVLFIGELSDERTASTLFTLFGAALIFAVAALAAFAVEMTLAGRGLRTRVEEQHSAAVKRKQHAKV